MTTGHPASGVWLNKPVYDAALDCPAPLATAVHELDRENAPQPRDTWRRTGAAHAGVRAAQASGPHPGALNHMSLQDALPGPRLHCIQFDVVNGHVKGHLHRGDIAGRLG